MADKLVKIGDGIDDNREREILIRELLIEGYVLESGKFVYHPELDTTKSKSE
ncbi:MAG: hypothetical protein LBT20_00570 [Clostridiales bacterium]|jgi:hypothetical protein|nr:hypothetical protein [Clostridiales bacterium]